MPLLCAELSSGLGGDTGFCSSLGCWGIQEENGGSPGSEAVDGVEQLVCFTIHTVLIPSPGRQQLVYRENSKDTLLQHHGFPGVTNSWKGQSAPRGLNTNSFHSAFPGLFFLDSVLTLDCSCFCPMEPWTLPLPVSLSSCGDID